MGNGANIVEVAVPESRLEDRSNHRNVGAMPEELGEESGSHGLGPAGRRREAGQCSTDIPPNVLFKPPLVRIPHRWASTVCTRVGSAICVCVVSGLTLRFLRFLYLLNRVLSLWRSQRHTLFSCNPPPHSHGTVTARSRHGHNHNHSYIHSPKPQQQPSKSQAKVTVTCIPPPHPPPPAVAARYASIIPRSGSPETSLKP